MMFADKVRKEGHKYQIQFSASETAVVNTVGAQPWALTKQEALQWVRQMLLRSRGSELIGNFNPHMIAALFWEQSGPWEKLAKAHIQQVTKLCEKFLSNLLDQVAPKDLKARIW